MSKHRWKGSGHCKVCDLFRRYVVNEEKQTNTSIYEYCFGRQGEWVGFEWFRAEKVPPCQPAEAAASDPPEEKKKNPGGRPCLLTYELQGRMVEIISAGNYRCTASVLAGITDETAGVWNTQGEKDAAAGLTTKFSEFSAAIKQARQVGVAYATRQVRAAMPNHWNAAAWWLERTDPKSWGRRDRLTLDMESMINEGVEEQRDKMLRLLRSKDEECADRAAEIMGMIADEQEAAKRAANG